MNFRKISERGGGVISDPKNFIAIFFALEKAILVMNFRKKLQKGVISDLKNFIANLVLVQPVCGKIFPEIHPFWYARASLSKNIRFNRNISTAG